MMGDSGRSRVLTRRVRVPCWRMVAGVASVALAGGALAACGTSNASTGPVTLNFYQYPDVSGAIVAEVKNCNAQSHGKYTISYQLLPAASDAQRLQMVRRLAAHDSSIDIMGLDVTWEAEFANAGWIVPWTGANRAAVENGTIKPALETAIWKGQLVAAPYNTNTELLAKEGKPHLIEIQGAQYEGTTVWFNTMNASAGGSVVNSDATKVTLGAPAVKALSIMKQLASSPAADPSLGVQMENDNRLAMEGGSAAFQLNYPFVYPSMKADNPAMFKHFKWALYPEVIPGVPAKVTIGGIDLAISSYSAHKALAFQAALCLRDKQNQLINATVGGVPPTLASLYSDPKLFADYPFHADILYALQHASVRPKSPTYQVVSISISHLISPPSGINPTTTVQRMTNQINDALQSKGLVP